ncbi:aldehyde dehydrogenase family protein [Marinigracilibium pacificum]|uniref:Aldehyde dehydrogenase n=1 Tax=Marinigracilibium pacificum TaxID=2729599 RepID=A0A848IV00_9BACT|nr:aldehyde dehydrogenase family protein [Marinigracilibium pacificum]NMM47115.1 aldehyde dehydrogenase family protein [Marinigracilibium pacificum]
MDTVITKGTGFEEQTKALFESQYPVSQQLRKSTVKQRIAKLKKLEKVILDSQNVIKEALFQDFQKPAEETQVSETWVVLAEIRHTCKNLKKWLKPQKVDTPLTLIGSWSSVLLEPKGRTLIIAPWNYPFNLSLGPLVSAVAAGNTALIKPSEFTPATNKVVTDILSKVFDKSEVAVVEGEIAETQYLLSLPFDHIFFTGSPAVGKIVMASAAKNLSGVTLELGGKSPTIINKDANLQDTAEKITFGKFLNAGQTCVAPDYLLVHKDIKDELVTKLISCINNKFNGKSEDSPYCNIINEKNGTRIKGLYEDAINNGAKVITGGKFENDNCTISPTLIEKVTFDMKIMEEEIFGPLLPIVEFEELAETVKIINSKPKPLALYYFGSKSKDQKYIIENCQSGTTAINDCTIQFANTELPFGGIGNSGVGNGHGYWGVRAFSHERPIMKQNTVFPSSSLLQPPYNSLKRMVSDLLVKYF